MNVLFVADIVGKPGRRILSNRINKLKLEHSVDLVIANGENSAGGFGITPDIAQELFRSGVEVITLGNHIWNRKEIIGYLPGQSRLIRPLNLPKGSPGSTLYQENIKGVRVALFCLLGRVFMGDCVMAECPFFASRDLLEKIRQDADVIIVEVHAEATSEKMALGYFLDGKAEAVIGTHTHISTTDARILPHGTAYITDIGMTGPADSVIGVDKKIIINKFLTQIPAKFEVAEGKAQLEGIIIKNIENKEARSISRIKEEEATL